MTTISHELPLKARRSFFARLLVRLMMVIAFLSLPWARWLFGKSEDDDVAGADVGADGAPRRWGMTIDLDLCTICGACATACQVENNIPPPLPGSDVDGTGIQWMDFVLGQANADQSAQPSVLPVPCLHCEDAPCVKVCPTGATYINSEGIVAEVYERCIGCRFCQVACPYSRRFFNWSEPQWPESYKNFLNPDVSTRPAGVIEKCNFCTHRIRKVRAEAKQDERTLTDSDFQKLPACAEACPAEAIVFGDLNESESLVSRLASSPRAFRLLEHLGTRPKVSYLQKQNL